MVMVEANLHDFPMAFEQKGNYQSNKLLIFRSNKLMKYPSRISNKDSRSA